MNHSIVFLRRCCSAMIAVAMLSVMFTAPTLAATQVNGEAAAVKVSLNGRIGFLGIPGPLVSEALADTGTLNGSNDSHQASMPTGSVLSLISAETLHATTFSVPDEVASETSLSNVGLNIGGDTIGLAFAMARASAPTGAAAQGYSEIDDLLVNGSLISVSGDSNQVVPLPGGKIILNEQHVSSTGTMVVNAIHIIIYGVGDVVIGTATAGSGVMSGDSLQTQSLLNAIVSSGKPVVSGTIMSEWLITPNRRIMKGDSTSSLLLATISKEGGARSCAV
ncbi:MAG: choice-of-anchor P family protein [Gammaproteobacteria bacterium]